MWTLTLAAGAWAAPVPRPHLATHQAHLDARVRCGAGEGWVCLPLLCAHARPEGRAARVRRGRGPESLSGARARGAGAGLSGTLSSTSGWARCWEGDPDTSREFTPHMCPEHLLSSERFCGLGVWRMLGVGVLHREGAEAQDPGGTQGGSPEQNGGGLERITDVTPPTGASRGLCRTGAPVSRPPGSRGAEALPAAAAGAPGTAGTGQKEQVLNCVPLAPEVSGEAPAVAKRGL